MTSVILCSPKECALFHARDSLQSSSPKQTGRGTSLFVACAILIAGGARRRVIHEFPQLYSRGASRGQRATCPQNWGQRLGLLLQADLWRQNIPEHAYDPPKSVYDHWSITILKLNTPLASQN